MSTDPDSVSIRRDSGRRASRPRMEQGIQTEGAALGDPSMCAEFERPDPMLSRRSRPPHRIIESRGRLRGFALE